MEYFGIIAFVLLISYSSLPRKYAINSPIVTGYVDKLIGDMYNENVRYNFKKKTRWGAFHKRN